MKNTLLDTELIESKPLINSKIPSEEITKILLTVMEAETGEMAWFYDLEHDLIYASENLNKVFGRYNCDPVSYDDFVSDMALITDEETLLKNRFICISQKREVNFQFTGICQTTGEEVDMLVKCKPYLNNEGEVIALYGTDKKIGDKKPLIIKNLCLNKNRPTREIPNLN